MNDLNDRLLEAHAQGDKQVLVRLYRAAAEETEEPTPKAFFLTQAYVFALDCGDPAAPKLQQMLVEMGRDEILKGRST